jgi:putative redox protein
MITAIRKNKYTVNLTNIGGEHSIISDIANDLGGDDLGLNPHELVEAALAACTTQTVLMYAGRKGWELPELRVEVKILKEAEESNIDIEIHFGDIPAENKVRLMEIAKKCPIHKLLKSKITIEHYEK